MALAKLNGPGVRCEIGICVQTGWIAWVNGPHPCGDWPDVDIARLCLHHVLNANENCVAGGGCRDKNGPSRTPTGMRSFLDRQRSVVRARHETVNARFKLWGILSQRYRHPLVKHGMVVNSIAIITQIMIQNGDSLVFQVECED